MDYSFNSQVAQIYGVDGAIFIHNLYWWIVKNEANGRHHYDGRTWTYNSMKAFSDLFPFWTKRQIERIIKNLKDRGAIHVGNFNKDGFDRTQWYALDETVYCIYANGDTHVTDPLHPCTQTVTPIPDSKPDNKPDNKPPLPPYDDYKPLDDEIRAFIENRRKMKSPMTDHAVQLMLKRLRGLSPNKKEQVEILEQSILNGWKGIFPLKVGDSQGEKWRQLE
ncbi:MAG: hypothetical protein ACLU3D_01950 [Acutalibacteraceae bacterium]|jgi:hypothetical protein